MSYENAHAVLAELYPHANDIARAVGVNPAANEGTVAEAWLLGLRDSLAEDFKRVMEADYPEDELWEYEKAPVFIDDQWKVWSELRLWQYDPDSAVNELADFFNPSTYRTDPHRAIKFSELPDLAQSYELEIAGTALSIMFSEAREAYNSNESE